MLQQQASTLTYYSDQFEPQCPLCQQGIHGTQCNTTTTNQETRGRVVYTSPERIVARRIITDQPQLLTPPKIISTQVKTTPTVMQKSPIVVQQSPIITQQSPVIVKQSPIILNQQPIIQQQSPIVASSQIIQQPIIQQAQPQIIQQQIIPQAQQITQQQQQISTQQNEQLLQELHLKEETLYQQSYELKQSQLAFIELQKAYQEQEIAYNQLQQVHTQYNAHYSTEFIPSFLQTVKYTVINKDGQTQYSQEEIELYWRHKVYELEEQIYQLYEKIKEKKNKRLPTQQAENQTQTEKLQREITQMDNILRIKQNSVVQLRNKLNDLIYQFDPATEATRDQDQELQNIRQRVMNLTSKYQELQDEIQMNQAQMEAVQTGKGYKFVSVTQTTSQVRQNQYNNIQLQSQKQTTTNSIRQITSSSQQQQQQ